MKIDQCKKLKEWGYPQDRDVEWWRQDSEDPTSIWMNNSHDSSFMNAADEEMPQPNFPCFAIPSVENLMEWLRLRPQLSPSEITLRVTHYNIWYAHCLTYHFPKRGVDGHASTALEALYALCEKVMEKDAK